MRFNGISATLWRFCKYSTASLVRPLACIVCTANASQASLGLRILKYQTSVFMPNVERDKGLKCHSWVKKLLALWKTCSVFCQARPLLRDARPPFHPTLICPRIAVAPSRDNSISADFPTLKIICVAYGMQTSFMGLWYLHSVQSSERTLRYAAPFRIWNKIQILSLIKKKIRKKSIYHKCLPLFVNVSRQSLAPFHSVSIKALLHSYAAQKGCGRIPAKDHAV